MSLVKCRECGTDISSQAKTCPKCGIEFPAPVKEVPIEKDRSEAALTPKKNPAMACFLSLIVPGLGQIYNGQAGKGIGLFILALLLGVGISISNAFILLLFPLYIFVPYDAYLTAKKINLGELKTY